MSTKQLQLLGVSFRTAPAAVRESLSFSRSETAELLHQSKSEFSGLEAAVLSTCNRTEFYLASEDAGDFVHKWLLMLRRLRPNAEILRSDCQRYQEYGRNAARHLFRVAGGLDSAILGDVQILGQVRSAMAIAAECGSLGATLERVFTQAIRAGKRARETTTIGWGTASLGAAVAGMLGGGLLGFERSRQLDVLVVGAGKMARDIARQVTKLRLGRVTIVNRSLEGARELAREFGAAYGSWSELARCLVAADCVVTATASPKPILTRELLDRVKLSRGGRILTVIDAGMPRNVETGSDARLIDIDSIRERQARVLVKRQGAIPSVEGIVEREIASWERWIATLPMERVIKQLYADAGDHSRLAASQLLGCTTMTQGDAEQFFERAFKHLLHGHVRRLRSLPALESRLCERAVTPPKIPEARVHRFE